MPITPQPGSSNDDIDMPPATERRRLGRTRPTRLRERANGILAITSALTAAIFWQDLVDLVVVLPPWIVWVLIAGFVGAAADVAACSFAGRPTRTASTVIVSVGSGITMAAVLLGLMF